MRCAMILLVMVMAMIPCNCVGLKSERVKSEKALIDLDKYGIVYSQSNNDYNFIYLLKKATLCVIHRQFESYGGYYNFKYNFIVKLLYSIKTVSTPNTFNVTSYSLDEDKSYLHISPSSADDLIEVEGCAFENRKYRLEYKNYYYILLARLVKAAYMLKLF